MYNERAIILFLLFLLPVSGCVLPTNGASGMGVAITDFTPDIQGDINSGEEVTFLVRMKNMGSVEAEQVYGEIIGLDYVWLPGEGKEKSQYDELFPNEERCRYTTARSGSASGITLLPADSERGTSGEEAVCTWTYKAPEVEGGLSITSEARARLYYTYTSATIKTITLVSREELKSLQNQGKGLPIETQSSTSSPLTFDIQSASPIKVYGDRAEFPIIITITNAGDGTLCRESSILCKKEGGNLPSEDLHRFKMDIALPAGMEIDGTCKETMKDVVMVGNRQQTLSCKVSGPVEDLIGISQKSIKLEARYGYFTDKVISLKVVPSNIPA